MLSVVNVLIQKLQANPLKIFLIDGFGAVVTVCFLTLVMTKFESYFGMPGWALCYLSAAGGCCALYSFTCYFFVEPPLKPYIKGIALLNLLYCLLTMVYVACSYQELTALGLGYFIAEIMLIGLLIYIEWQLQSRV